MHYHKNYLFFVESDIMGLVTGGISNDRLVTREIQLSNLVNQLTKKGKCMAEFLNDNRLNKIADNAGAVIRTVEVLSLLGVSRMTVYRWVKAGKFPAPLVANGRAFGWRYKSVLAWMDQLQGGEHVQ